MQAQVETKPVIVFFKLSQSNEKITKICGQKLILAYIVKQFNRLKHIPRFFFKYPANTVEYTTYIKYIVITYLPTVY